MSYFFDIVVVAIIVVSIVLAIKKGFIKSLMGTVAVVVSLVLAWSLSTAVSAPIYNGFVYNYTEEKIEAALQKNEGGEIKLVEIIDKLPDYIEELLAENGIDKEQIAEKYNKLLSQNEISPEKSIVMEVSKPIATLISRAIAFAVLFAVFMILLSVGIYIVDKICKLPGLNIMNKGLGAVVGAVKGLIFAVAISMIICNLMPFLSVLNESIPQDIVEKTTIVKYLGNFEFMSLL